MVAFTWKVQPGSAFVHALAAPWFLKMEVNGLERTSGSFRVKTSIDARRKSLATLATRLHIRRHKGLTRRQPSEDQLMENSMRSIPSKLAIFGLVLISFCRTVASDPQVPGGTISLFANVTDPQTLAFAPDGTLYAGRDNLGS